MKSDECIDFYEDCFVVGAHPFGDSQLHVRGRRYPRGWGIEVKNCFPYEAAWQEASAAHGAHLLAIGKELMRLGEQLCCGTQPIPVSDTTRQCA